MEGSLLKCLLCNKFSFSHICKQCQLLYLSPSLLKRELSSGLTVYSFYQYSDIEDLIKSKKSYLGFYILQILTKNSILKFIENLDFEQKTYLVPVDDRVGESGYSHTAVITKVAEKGNKNLKPLFRTLIATNRVNYFGKDAKFRRENRRDFKVNRKINQKPTILIDDVITTGSTLLEAEESLKNQKSKPLFALTLATTERV